MQKLEKLSQLVNELLQGSNELEKLEMYRYFFIISLEQLEVDFSKISFKDLQILQNKEGLIKSDWNHIYDMTCGIPYGLQRDLSDKVMPLIKKLKE